MNRIKIGNAVSAVLSDAVIGVSVLHLNPYLNKYHFTKSAIDFSTKSGSLPPFAKS